MRSFHSTMAKESMDQYSLRNGQYFDLLVELLDDEDVAALNLFRRG